MIRKKIVGGITAVALLISALAILPLNFQTVQATPTANTTSNIIFTIMPDGSVQLSTTYFKQFNSTYSRTFVLSITENTIILNRSESYHVSSTYPSVLKLALDILNNRMNFTFSYDWSFNSTDSPIRGDLDFSIDYNGDQGVLNISALLTDFNMTEILEHALSASLPFEIPSFTGSLNINKGVLTGLFTLATNEYIGLPVKVNLWLNNTHMRLYGDGGLIYQGESFNYTHLELVKQFMEGLVGTGDDSLYNITNTYVLCTYSQFTYTNTTFGGVHPGALINFDFKAENSTWGLRKVFMTPLIYSTLGGEDWNRTAAIMYEYEQMVGNSVGGSTLAYNSATQKLTWSGSQTIELKKVINSLKPPIVVGWWPPDYCVPNILYVNNSDLYEFFSEVFAASRLFEASFTISINTNMANGTGRYAASGILDFKDIVKDYKNFINGTLPFFNEWWWNENITIVEAHREIEDRPGYYSSNGWQKYTGGYQAIEYYINNIDEYWLECYNVLMDWWLTDASIWYVLEPISFNSTIKNLDLKFSNFYVESKLEEGYGYTEKVSGLIISPPKIWVNSSWYNLNSLFEAEAGIYPAVNQSLGITVSGGSNGTHHTILSYEGLTAPDNIVYDDQGNVIAMFWANKTIPVLKDLLFSVASGDVTGGYIDPNYLPAIFSVPPLGITLTIYNISNPTGLLISKALNPPTPGEGLTPISYYINITATDAITNLDAWLTFHYTDEQIAGVDENSLSIYWFNPNTNMYESLSEVIHNTAENWISGHLTHFSVFVVFSFTPTLPWLIIIIPIVVVVAVAVSAYFILRRNRIKGRVEK